MIECGCCSPPPVFIDHQVRAVVVASRSDLVADEVAGADRPLLVDLQRGVLTSPRKRVDQGIIQTDCRRVEDAPIGHAAEDPRQERGLLLPERDGLVQQLGQEFQ